MMTTDSGFSDSTLAAINPVIAVTVAGWRWRLLRSFSTTDAFVGCSRPTNSDGCGMAMCTRAPATSLIVEIVRASSPSSARR